MNAIAQMLDEELMAIANGNQKASASVSSMSDEELMKIANVTKQPEKTFQNENMARVPRAIIPGVPGMQPPTFQEANMMGEIASQGLSGVNRAISTASGNLSENLMNLAGKTGYAENENPLVKSTGEAIGFVMPTGAPMRAIKAAEVIKNPLLRNVIQGAGAMATQLPTKERGIDEYNTGVLLGAAGGVAGRGVEKVAEGAIQQGAKAVSGRIHDYLVKLPTGAFKWSKNPLKVAADESIIAGNMGEYAEKATERLAERSAQLEAAVQNSNKTVDVEDMVSKHLNEAAGKLSGSLKDRTSQIAELNTVRENLVAKYGDLKNLSVQDAIKLKRQLADDFPFTQEGAGDIATKSAHKIYHDINEFVEAAHPEIAELNQRVSGLIDISKAAQNRMAVESRNNPLGLVARLGAGGALIGGAAMGHTPEGIISALGIMGAEKAMQSPAVLTRVAKALSAMSGEDRLKVMKAYPQLNKVIKIDSRDVEILPNTSMNALVGRPIPKRGEVIDVKGGQVVEGLPFEQKKGIPNLSAEKVYKGRGQAIRQGTESGEGVISLKAEHVVSEEGGTSIPKAMEVVEQGETVVPVKKTPIKTKKESIGTPIPRRSGILGSNKGQVIFPDPIKENKDVGKWGHHIGQKVRIMNSGQEGVIESFTKNNIKVRTTGGDTKNVRLSDITARGVVGATALGAGIASNSEASSDIDMNKIYSIESSNNEKAHNKSSNAKGLGQITPIVLKEWNNLHPKDKHSDRDLFNKDVNKKIASWYMNKRIPQMLKSMKKPDTAENRLIAYNAGIGRVGKILPRETANYIKKYKGEK